jgi:RimJ/RimL family protein N-acetyltransferase
MFTIETPRLSLRPLCDEDEALYCSLYCDPDTMRFVGPIWSAQRAARSFRKSLDAADKDPPDYLILTLFERATKRSIGICGIPQFDTSRTRAEVGILLVSAAREQGFAREGLRALIKQTFQAFPVEAIWVECARGFSLVERMVSSIGFRLCADSATEGEPGSKRNWWIQRTSWCYPAIVTK